MFRAVNIYYIGNRIGIDTNLVNGFVILYNCLMIRHPELTQITGFALV